MTTTRNAPEPWAVQFPTETVIVDSRGYAVASTGFQCKDNAARIVRCVNFCAGLSNEEMVGTALEQIVNISTVFWEQLAIAEAQLNELRKIKEAQ